MAVPKRKTSKSRLRTRRRSHKRPLPSVGKCSNCEAPSQPHRICRSCGCYNGRQVLTNTIDD